MLQKIKDFLLGKVILQKVLGKFIKHGITALAALMVSKPYLAEAGVTIDYTKLESWALVAASGLAGAAWNFLDHRFRK